MLEAAFVGALFAIGLILLLRGMNPPLPTLEERISTLTTYDDLGRRVEDDEEETFDALRERVAVRLLAMIKGDGMRQTRADLAVARIGVEAYAIDKFNAGLGGGILLAALGSWGGWVSSLSGILIVGIIGAAFSYWIPDLDLRKKAAAARIDFLKALNAFVGLVSVSMTGGGGLNTAMADAASVGRGWSFDMLTATLDEAAITGENSWTALDRLGRRLQIESLIELAGALALAGDSGARITETMLARGESGRAKEIADVREMAEKRSANLVAPLGALLAGWMGFIGYPAAVSLLQGFGA